MPTLSTAVESKDQLIAVWTRLVEDRGGTVDLDAGVCRLWADSIFGFWNSVTLTGENIAAEALGGQLTRAADFMRGRSEPGYLWLFEDLLDPRARAELPERMANAGLALSFSGHGMAGELTIPEPAHPELEFRRVRTEEDLLVYGAINAAAYEMSPDAGRAALSGSKLWLTDAYAYLGLRDGRPVTCASTIAGPTSVFLALVATLPGEERRGYGEAVTRKAIHEGIRHSGQRRVVLHATAAGRLVYERIGCRANTSIHFLQLA